MVYLVQFRDRAAYPPGHDLSRTGAEAFFIAGRVLAEVIRDVGGEPLLGGFPTSVMVDAESPDGDGGWDYVGAARYPVAGRLREAVAQSPDRAGGRAPSGGHAAPPPRRHPSTVLTSEPRPASCSSWRGDRVARDGSY